jgi:hypothetical protein
MTKSGCYYNGNVRKELLREIRSATAAKFIMHSDLVLSRDVAQEIDENENTICIFSLLGTSFRP